MSEPEWVDEMHVLSLSDLQRAYETLAQEPAEPQPIILGPRSAEALRRWYLNQWVDSDRPVDPGSEA